MLYLLITSIPQDEFYNENITNSLIYFENEFKGIQIMNQVWLLTTDLNLDNITNIVCEKLGTKNKFFITKINKNSVNGIQGHRIWKYINDHSEE